MEHLEQFPVQTPRNSDEAPEWPDEDESVLTLDEVLERLSIAEILLDNPEKEYQ